MAITTAFPTSFKRELFEGRHNFRLSGGATFKLVLIKQTEAGTYGAATADYGDVTGNTDEHAATGDYTTGGVALTRVDPAEASLTGYVDFADLALTGVTVDSDGCMIYNDTDGSDTAVYVGSFGGAVTVTAGTLNITFPAATADAAILRIGA